MKPASIKPVRCAIYTRVSTEHGLDQEFNSLDAQYDVASAYIKSQAHAGWALIRSRKSWAADFDLAAAGGAGHRRIAEMSLIEARLRSTLASGCDDAARPARRRLETSCGVHHRGDRSRTPMDSSTRPSMLSSPPPIPSDSDVDRRRASCSHSRNIASFSSRDS